MSSLPPKPDFDPHDRDKYPADDRHYSRHYPPPPPSRESRGYRDHADSYVPGLGRPSRPPTMGDSYVPPSYDRRHDDRSRPYDGGHHSARQNWEHDSRPYPREWRDPYDRRDPPPRHRESEWRRRDDSVERRREWESRRDPPPPRVHPREYSRDHRRDRDHEYRPNPRDEERHHRIDPSPPDRRRTSRASISPSRRPDYESRRRSPPQRWSVSPRRRSRPPRSPLPVRNDQQSHSPTPRKVAPELGSNSANHESQEPGIKKQEKSEVHRSSSPRRALSRERRSNSPIRPEPDEPSGKMELVTSEELPKSFHGSPQEENNSSELSQEVMAREPPRDKGKARVFADRQVDADGDVKMREQLLPRQPRAPASSSLQIAEATLHPHPRIFRRSPPTGPRHQGKTTNSGQSSPALPPNQDRGLRDSVLGTLQKVPSGGIDDTPPHKSAPAAPVIQLPLIPVYNSEPIKFDLQMIAIENDLQELQAHRARIAAEYVEIGRAARKAIHDLEMSTVDLNMARMRREVADAHMEKARQGRLGIDFDGVFSD